MTRQQPTPGPDVRVERTDLDHNPAGGGGEGGAGGGGGGRGVSPRRAFWASFGLLFALFSLWAIANPLTAAPDEPSHATKAAAVVRGQLVGDPVPEEPDGFGSVHVPNVIWQSQAYPICYYFKPEVTAACEPAEPADPNTIVYAVTTASSYNPLYYVPTGLPSLLPIGEEMLYLMRLVSAALCAFALAWAVRSLAELRAISWPMLGLAAATTPMVVFLASSISPAGLEVCVSIGLWTGLLGIVHQPDPDRLPARMAGVGVLAAVLVNLRGMSPLFLAIIVVTVVASAPWANSWVALRDRRSWPWLGLVAVASAAALAWLRTAGALPTSEVLFPEWPFDRAAATSVYATPVYLRNMVGQFGWVDTELPLVMVVAWLALIGGAAIAALVVGTWRQRIVLAGLGLVTLGLPVLIHASQAKFIGIVWQGRYFLPAAVGVPLLTAFVLRDRGRLLAWRWLRWGLAALLLGQLVAFAVNVHRYVAGENGPWFGEPAGGWEPPVGAWVLVAACAAILAWLLRLLLTTTARAAGPGDAPVTTPVTTPVAGADPVPTAPAAEVP